MRARISGPPNNMTSVSELQTGDKWWEDNAEMQSLLNEVCVCAAVRWCACAHVCACVHATSFPARTPNCMLFARFPCARTQPRVYDRMKRWQASTIKSNLLQRKICCCFQTKRCICDLEQLASSSATALAPAALPALQQESQQTSAGAEEGSQAPPPPDPPPILPGEVHKMGERLRGKFPRSQKLSSLQSRIHGMIHREI